MNASDIRDVIRKYERNCILNRPMKGNVEAAVQVWFSMTRDNGYVDSFTLNWLSDWQLVVEFIVSAGQRTPHHAWMNFPYMDTTTVVPIVVPNTNEAYDRAMKGI